jgi:DNA polymerase-3 subunit delta'
MSLFDDDIMDDNVDNIGFDTPELLTQQQGLNPANRSSFFIGHDAIENNMLDLWHANRMPHALIFNGIKGIGKATFAYRLARFIMSQNKNDTGGFFGEDEKAKALDISHDHPVISKIASGGHPDFRAFGLPFDDAKGQFKRDIPVEDIRKIAPFLRQSSSNGGWRIVIIDDANTMGRAGQNALLKILEEPPKNALLILITHGAGGLLPTIRSRCRFVSFDPLPNTAIHELMQKSSSTPLMPNDVDLITALAEGSAGKAIDLIQNGDIGSLNAAIDLLITIKDHDEDKLNSVALAYGKSGDKHAADQLVTLVQWYLQTLIHMRALGKKTKTFGHTEIHLPNETSLYNLMRLYDTVNDHIEMCVRGNLDKRYMIYKLLRLIKGD